MNQIWITNETTSLSREISSHFGEKSVVNYDPTLNFFKTSKSLITGETSFSFRLDT